MALLKSNYDPYRFENMYSIFLNLSSRPAGMTLSPTGMYVRVLPSSEYQLDYIESDTNQLWFDYPLDCEVVNAGYYYQDPNTPTDSITWLYGVVPLNYQFADSIFYEVLYDVFIPEDAPDYNDIKDFYDLLEATSCDIAASQNGTYSEKPVDTKASTQKWTPSATITYQDQLASTSDIPLGGVRVVFKKGTKVSDAITNSAGQCQSSKKFRDKVEYSIKWDRKYWKIRYDKNQAYTTGPKSNSSWTLNMQESTIDNMFALIHRALITTYYGNFGNIEKPTVTFKMKIGYIHGYDPSYRGIHTSSSTIFTKEIIKIWGLDSTFHPRKPHQIIQTAFHELGHRSHLNFVGKNKFVQTNKFIKESWAVCIAWAMIRSYYASQGVTLSEHDGHIRHYQYLIPGTKQGDECTPYTAIFVDLMDTYNQHSYYNELPNDNISNYTLKQIQDNLIYSARDLSTLQNALNTYLLNGTTTSDVSTMVGYYSGFGY